MRQGRRLAFHWCNLSRPFPLLISSWKSYTPLFTSTSRSYTSLWIANISLFKYPLLPTPTFVTLDMMLTSNFIESSWYITRLSPFYVLYWSIKVFLRYLLVVWSKNGRFKSFIIVPMSYINMIRYIMIELNASIQTLLLDSPPPYHLFTLGSPNVIVFRKYV